MSEPVPGDPRTGWQPPSLTALYQLAPRTGARSLEWGWDRAGCPVEEVRWWVKLTYPRGNVASITGALTYDDAFVGIVKGVLSGGECQGCRKTAVVGVEGEIAEIPENVVFALSGEKRCYALDELGPSSLCAWELVGEQWERWCGVPAPAGSSRELLAQALIGIGAHAQFIGAARMGRYDENLSAFPLPKVELVGDLRLHGPGAEDLIERVVNGEFTATAEETEAYRRSQVPTHDELREMLLRQLIGPKESE